MLFARSDPGWWTERHPAGDGGRSRNQMFRQRPGNKCTSQPIPACEDHVRPAAGHVQPVQPGGGLSHHEPEERVSYNASRQTRQLLHQGTKKICFFFIFLFCFLKRILKHVHMMNRFRST